MAPRDPLEIDTETILFEPELVHVYSILTLHAHRLAVLGRLGTAEGLMNLLFSECVDAWQREQFRHLQAALEASRIGPDSEITIQPREEAEKLLDQTLKLLELDEKNKAATAEEKLAACLASELVGFCNQNGDKVVGDVLSVAIGLASPSSDIESDENVQKALDYVAQNFLRFDSFRFVAFGNRRDVWLLLSSGAVARKLGLDAARVDAFAEKSTAALTERLKLGRQPVPHAGRPMKELLKVIEENNKTVAVSCYEERLEEVPQTLFVLPGASDDQIAALENRLGVTLPSDYKEFLKLTNGFGGIFNSIHLDPALCKVDEVDWSEMSRDYALPIQVAEYPCGNFLLPDESGRNWEDWPKHSRAVCIASEDVFEYLLIPPEETRKVIEAYEEALSKPQVSEATKTTTRNGIDSRFGSWDKFKSVEWMLLSKESEGGMDAYGSFTDFLEIMAWQSGKILIPTWGG